MCAAKKKQAKRPQKSGVKLTRSEAAYLLRVSERQLARLADLDENPLPVERRNRGRGGWVIDGQELVFWFLKYEIQKQAPKKDRTLDAEILRRTTEQADKLALENAVVRKEYVKASHVSQFIMEVLSVLGAGLDSIPGRLCNELAGLDSPAKVKKRLSVELRKHRNVFADRCAELAEFEASDSASD